MVGGVMRDLLSVRRRGPPNSPHNQTPACLLSTASRQRRGVVCRLSATGSGMARHEPRIKPWVCSFVLVASAACAAKSEPYRDFAAGMALGLVIWSYFYFWTACMLALALCFLLDSGHRALYAKVGALGLIVGSPALVSSYLLKHATSHDWLWRSD